MVVPVPDLCIFSDVIYIYRVCYELYLNYHYENLPVQYTEIFKVQKMKIFSRNILIFFLFLLKT